MWLDLISAAFGGGIVVAASVSYYLYRMRAAQRKQTQPSVVTPPRLDLKSRGVEKQVTEVELERAKRELKILLLEKELVTGAITRLYEAEATGKIGREDRERLSAKYKEQLREIEAKLNDLNLIIEVGELENLRQELLNLFEKKIAQIEDRLREARAQLEALRGVQQPVTEEPKAKTTVEEKKVERRKKPPESEAESKIKELREEILDALARLEQIDLEG
jgi:hypothetical protein